MLTNTNSLFIKNLRGFLSCFFVFAIFKFQFIFGASIHTIESFAEVSQELEHLDAETLVVFDINDVLILPKDQILRSYAKLYRLGLIEKYFRPLDEKKVLELSHQILLYKRKNYQLVEVETPLMIKQMQTKGAKVIALTSGKREFLGSIDDLEEAKIQILQELGIDFQGSFPDTPLLVIEGKQFKENSPVFRQGIIFARPYAKGPVLEAFLQKINYHPKKVILFDNKMENHESMNLTMKAAHIDFKGFYYQAVERLPHHMDLKVAEFQFRYLVKQGKWIGEEQAKQKLREKKHL